MAALRIEAWAPVKRRGRLRGCRSRAFRLSVSPMAGPKKKKNLAKRAGGGSLIGMRSGIKRVAGAGKKKPVEGAQGKSPVTWQRVVTVLIAVAIGAAIAFGMSKR
jgi:hypothetical protein